MEWLREFKDSLRHDLASEIKTFIEIIHTKTESYVLRNLLRANSCWRLIEVLEAGQERNRYVHQAHSGFVRGSVEAVALPTVHPHRIAITLALTKFMVVVLRNPESALQTAELAAKLAKGSIQTLGKYYSSTRDAEPEQFTSFE